jgi:hypothetical protein
MKPLEADQGSSQYESDDRFLNLLTIDLLGRLANDELIQGNSSIAKQGA